MGLSTVYVHRSQINITDNDSSWSAEASTLGLPVGQFPQVILIGAADEFRFIRYERDAEGDVQYARYLNPNDGWILKVWND